MFRLVSRAVLLVLIVAAAGCGEGTAPTPFVSEAVAAPATAPDYGWRTNMSPNAGEGAVTEYY